MSKPQTDLQMEISQMTTEKIARLSMIADEMIRIKNDELSRIGNNNDAMKFAMGVIALKYNIPLADREKEFALIGCILGSRPRKKRAVKTEKLEVKFSVLRKGKNIVEFTSTVKIIFEFVRNSNNIVSLLSHMGTHQPSQMHITEALNFAEKYFKENND